MPAAACILSDVTDTAGKVFQAEHGMRRCKVCEKLFPPAEAARHASVPCQPEPPKATS
jgi:hypothetical protein